MKLIKDKEKRISFQEYELKKISYKALLREKISLEKKKEILKLLTKLPRRSSITQIKNRCILTGRAHGILKRFKISRIKFRELAACGLIPGVTKASW
uniref:Ribosomal protein S14 n=1 Tax=Mesostigma viride TaxID=41882 RepID=G8DKE5_MESVI|nr:ribosomal protein S14 [Mesostigma viride]